MDDLLDIVEKRKFAMKKDVLCAYYVHILLTFG